MKVLLLHPYGTTLGDWNHRLKRQIELMSKVCDLRVIGGHIPVETGPDGNWKNEVQQTIKEFNPDIIYVSGFLLAFWVSKWHDKVILDGGAYKTRNILVEQNRLTYIDIRKMTRQQLIERASQGQDGDFFRRENEVIEKVKEIIVWEGEEASLIKKIHNVGDKVHEISMIFYDLPKPIPWEEKEGRVMAVAAKWGEKGKNGRLLDSVNKKIKERGLGVNYYVQSIGHGGSWAYSMSHDELMDEMNNTKVIFCPYICGGIGVINEGLKLGCNVVVGDWHPYLVYVNNELIINSENNVVDGAVDMIEKVMKQYYPPKKPLPAEEEQLKKIMKLIENYAKV